MTKKLTVLLLLVFALSADANDVDDFPWSQEYECVFGEYAPTGLFPTMHASLRDLKLEHRITRGLDTQEANWNYHQADFSHDGAEFSAAVDISTRCLEDEQIKDLLGELAERGFAAWLREKDKDGWTGSKHIHAVWASAKLKPQLSEQIRNWLLGRNGLASNLKYKFWEPSEDQKLSILLAYQQAN